MNDKLKVYGIAKESIVDGTGIRYVVFTQGCPHRCKGCHNPKSHDFDGGVEMDTQQIVNDIKKNLLLSGITFSGGEPFCQPKPLYNIGVTVKQMGLNVWAYTGYTFEELLSQQDPYIIKLLQLTDVLVDGKFEIEQKSLTLKFKGSKNQRVIDVEKSLKQNKVVLLNI